MSLQGKDFISLGELPTPVFRRLVDRALEAKRGAALTSLAGQTLAAIFFNPSLRTRFSFQIAMERLGGSAIVVNAGGDLWTIEFRDGVVMDGQETEHVKEAARVLARYAQAIAVRAFPSFRTYEDDCADRVLRGFARESAVPVINMESSMHHPCQGLADAITVVERLGETAGCPLCLTWAWHPKPLPLAVPHSALHAGAHLGMDIRLACPPGYEPDPDVLRGAGNLARQHGGSLTIVHDQAQAMRGARVVYAKSWRSIGCWGDAQAEADRRKPLRAWQVTGDLMALTDRAFFMHCLPVRRNVVVSDDVLDGPDCAAYDEAENRLWGQMAVLSAVMAGDT